MDQFVGIVTGLETTTLICATQGIPNLVRWEKQINASFPTEVMTNFTLSSNQAESTLSIRNISNVSIGGMYRCVASFADQQVPSSFALLNVSGMYFLF